VCVGERRSSLSRIRRKSRSGSGEKRGGAGRDPKSSGEKRVGSMVGTICFERDKKGKEENGGGE